MLDTNADSAAPVGELTAAIALEEHTKMASVQAKFPAWERSPYWVRQKASGPRVLQREAGAFPEFMLGTALEFDAAV